MAWGKLKPYLIIFVCILGYIGDKHSIEDKSKILDFNLWFNCYVYFSIYILKWFYGYINILMLTYSLRLFRIISYWIYERCDELLGDESWSRDW